MPQTLEELRHLLSALPSPDNAAQAAAKARNDLLTKPQGALGKLEDLALWLAAWQGRAVPRLDKIQMLVFAGNHGVVARGVSAFPAEVTVQMVANFANGGAAINQLCRAAGAELKVLDLDLDRPTADFTQGPAMDMEEFLDALNKGMAQVGEDADLVCIGEMGIGNTTASAAICHALYGGEAADWVGPGTGVEGDALTNKIRVVKESVILHKAVLTDGLEILRCFGGRREQSHTPRRFRRWAAAERVATAAAAATMTVRAAAATAASAVVGATGPATA